MGIYPTKGDGLASQSTRLLIIGLLCNSSWPSTVHDISALRDGGWIAGKNPKQLSTTSVDGTFSQTLHHIMPASDAQESGSSKKARRVAMKAVRAVRTSTDH